MTFDTVVVMPRPLREKLYRAFITRASSGETDNTPLIEKTLQLRLEQAQLLGFPNYAEVSLASKVGWLCAHWYQNYHRNEAWAGKV
jgi:Zn-dependent oligopeptidase